MAQPSRLVTAKILWGILVGVMPGRVGPPRLRHALHAPRRRRRNACDESRAAQGSASRNCSRAGRPFEGIASLREICAVRGRRPETRVVGPSATRHAIWNLHFSILLTRLTPEFSRARAAERHLAPHLIPGGACSLSRACSCRCRRRRPAQSPCSAPRRPQIPPCRRSRPRTEGRVCRESESARSRRTPVALVLK